MTVRLYKSTDASAPVLTGQTGSLNDLIHAILVAGYGALTAAGWTREYNDTTSKTMVWRPSDGSRHYLQSQDNGPGAGTFKEARWRGYETMSAYNTGTGAFPTSTQMTNGLFVRKSTTADATARTWWALADEKTLHLFIDSADTSGGPLPYTFGGLNSWKASDAYASIIAGRTTENSATINLGPSPNIGVDAANGTTTMAYAPRSYSAVGTAIALTQRANHALMQNTGTITIGSAGEAYPNPVDGGILLSPLYLGEGLVKRGTMRGMWAPCHSKPILQNDTFSATDGATTRNFIAINLTNTGQIFIETSDTWDTP